VDVTPYLTVQPAPRAVLDRPAARADEVRFRVRRPDGTWRAVTWGDFAAAIRGVAAHLAAAGIAPGERCAIYAPNSVAWAAAALGIQAAGAVMVPIYPASTAAQLAYVLGHARVRALFVAGAEAHARLAEVRAGLPGLAHVVALDDPAAWAAVTATPDPGVVDARLAALDLDAPGLLLYTSGTSGPPKGVPLTHRNVGANAADWLTCNAPLLAAGDRDLLWLPMSHIFGFGELCLGNTLGWESWLASPAEVLDRLPEVAPQVFLSVPAYWEKLARAVLADAGEWGDREARRRALVRRSGGRLRFCLSGGAGLKVEIKELLHDCGVLVIEGYGLTETAPTLTLNRPDAFRFDAVGRPLPSVALRLDDDGEILARGPNVFAGYLDDPEATAAAFTADGWFRTGDIGRFTEDGFLQIVDRKKDILVTAGGKNVPPANIEARFADDPVIERCVVYGDGKPYLVAALWVAPGRQAEVAARIEAANAGLARFETIKKWFVADEPLTVEDGLLTASLKLRRKAVYERLRDRFEALYP
jgi:long-chain acyl-CoA synthetase